MTTEQNPRECVVCREAETTFIHTVSNGGVYRRLCTDCLLKEHRELFCPVCFHVFDSVPPSPHARIVCANCPSITHVSCSHPPPSSTAASSSSSSSAPAFTCPPCSNHNFTFFPKSRVDDDVPERPIDVESARALVAAANIAVTSMNKAVAHLKDEANKKVVEAQKAKLKAKTALQNLQDLVVKPKASENKKRKNDDR